MTTTAPQTKLNFQIKVYGEPVQINLEQSFQEVISDIRNVGDDIISEQWFYLQATDLEVVFCRCKDYLDELINFLLENNNPQSHNLLKEAGEFFEWEKDENQENGIFIQLQKDKVTDAVKALWEASF